MLPIPNAWHPNLDVCRQTRSRTLSNIRALLQCSLTKCWKARFQIACVNERCVRFRWNRAEITSCWTLNVKKKRGRYVLPSKIATHWIEERKTHCSPFNFINATAAERRCFVLIFVDHLWFLVSWITIVESYKHWTGKSDLSPSHLWVQLSDISCCCCL